MSDKTPTASTDRTRAGPLLAGGEGRFRSLIENASDLVGVLDVQGVLVYVSPSVQRLFGYEASEVLGKPLLQFIHPDDVQSSQADLSRLLQSADPVIAQRRFLHKNGNWLTLETISKNALDDTSIAGIIINARDITERTRIEATLRNSEAELKAAQRVAKIGNWHLDLATDAVSWSEEIYRVFELDPALPAPYYATHGQLFTTASAERLNAAIENTKRTGTPYEIDLEVRRADGTAKWIVARGEVVRDDHGQIVALRGTAQDISERKDAENAVRKSNRALRVLGSCNQALIHADEEQQLLGDICRVIVEESGYRLAWVGTAEQDAEKSVRPVAQCGLEDGYLDELEITWADSERGRGPTGTAVRTGCTQVNQDFATDPGLAPWREQALRRGFRSSVALPLASASAVLGALTIYAAEPNAFDAGEIKLLEDLADDLAFGITVLRARAAHARAESALRDSEEKFRKISSSAQDAIILMNHEGKVVFWNEAAQRMYGYAEEEIVGEDLHQMLVPERHRTAYEPGLQKFFATGEGPIIGKPRELMTLRKGGAEFPVEMIVSAIPIDGKWHAAAMVRDITERKEAERKIVQLNRVYAMLGGINTLIVRVRDRDELFREACRIAVEGGGFRMSLIAMVDQGSMKIVPVASAGKDEELLTAIEGILSSSEGAQNTMTALALREKKVVVSNDSQSDPRVLFGKKYAEAGVRSMAVLPLIVSGEAVGALALYASESEFFHEEEVKLLTELAGDIAFAIDYIDKGEKLNYLAYYDVLTGLANRSLFLERVAQYLRSAGGGGHKLALFLIDLERFKNISDSLGRAAGDALLRQVAEWLTRNAGDANLVARVGADHFALVMPQVKQGGDVARLLEKWTNAFLEHPFRLNDAAFRIAAKVGVALFPDDGVDADTLFKNAEAALKKAKAGGERYLFYTQKMNEAVAGRLALENQLRQALDNEEFVLHYQPKVNLVSGKLIGAEALIRWNDPRTGLVPPARFIPILEETGLIYEVGRWALRQAIADYLRWRSAGLDAVRIAVNVSPLQLRNRGFIDDVRQAIGIDAQAPAGLELEITESLIMEDIKHNIASLQVIRAMGVSIAVDDFGTGFSSLSYLAKLPVDTLKIDRSFVIDMTEAPEGLTLVSTIISLAHSLKLNVVAEGVETEEQLRLLRLLACDEMQGFLFSKPVPGEIFETKFLAPPPTSAR